MTAANQSGGQRMVTSAERLRRLLALVPYVVHGGGQIGLPEAAATFGMTERELIDDLNLAWCVELKSPEPYCPIDLSYEDGEITISQAESIARPLRLAADEASALLVALRMLAEAGGGRQRRHPAGGEDRGCGRRIGGRRARSSQSKSIVRTAPASPPPSTLPCAAGKRIHLRYYVPGRDEATERDVDPVKLLVDLDEGRTYLRGWSRLAEEMRTFRLDRVLDVAVLELPAETHPDRSRSAATGGCSVRRRRTCRSSSSWRPARWVADYYPCESLTELGDGRLRVAIHTPNTDWVRRLALRLGEDGRVIAPAELAQEVREAAAAALALYD